MDEETLRKYFLSRLNTLKIVLYREYIIEDDDVLAMLTEDFESFKEKYENFTLNEMKENMSDYFFEKEQPKSKTLKNTRSRPTKNLIMIRWNLDHKLNNVVDLVNTLENNKITKALVIADEGITPNCKDALKNVKIIKKITVDVWTLKESMIFVPDHILVPPHRICSAREKIHIMNVYGLKTVDKFPYISSSDVMVKYLGAIKGNLIEIIRQSETDATKNILTYRIVVSK
jgi:DNA-directed RNA polymerase subunit H (RpoH/RPB5)